MSALNPTRIADDWNWPTEYERYAGRWSRLVADRFVTFLDQPPGLAWLDVGCGVGALSAAILRLASPSGVLGIDRSQAFVDAARSSTRDARARFEVGSAEALALPDDSVDVTVSGLVLNFLPDIAVALREQMRVTRSNGWVGGYAWDYAAGMQMMRFFWDAAVELDPSASGRDEAVRFPLAQPEPLTAAWQGAGLRRIEAVAIEVSTVFRDFEDYWSPFLSRIGPAPSYVMSLPDDARMRLRERLRERLPRAADGSIALTARAWAVRGERP